MFFYQGASGRRQAVFQEVFDMFWLIFDFVFAVFKADGMGRDIQTAILYGDDVIARPEPYFFHLPHREHYEVSKIALDIP